MDAQTLMGSRNRKRLCSGPRQRWVFFILVFMAVIFVIFNSKIFKITHFSQWMPPHSATQTSRFLESGKRADSAKKNLSTTGIKSTSGSGTATRISGTNGNSTTTRISRTNKSTTAARIDSPTRTRINGTKRSSTTTRINSTNGSSTTSTTSTTSPNQKDSTPPVRLPPYVSPGPYFVEYPYPYHLIINEPRTCHVENPFLVLVVPVAPKNQADRDVIRRSWGGESLVLGKVVKLFFLLGLHSGEDRLQIQELLQQESLEHRDLIQSNFVDCYKNLTIKTMVMLEWLDTYCSNAAYATKVDSDMFLNLPNLVNMLAKAPKMNYLTGRVLRITPAVRDKKSKWYLPKEVYPRLLYPPFAHGCAYVLSLDLPKKLLGAAKHLKALHTEDVFLGECMEHLGLQLTDPPHWYSFHILPLRYIHCIFSKIIAAPTYKNADRVWMWNDLKRPSLFC